MNADLMLNMKSKLCQNLLTSKTKSADGTSSLINIFGQEWTSQSYSMQQE